jgi:hypothetical protein
MIGKTFLHFKGNKYKVLMIALDCRTVEEVVVYQSLQKDKKIWTRDLKEFCDIHESGVKRFVEIEDEPEIIPLDINEEEVANGLWDVLAEVIDASEEISNELCLKNFYRLPQEIIGIGFAWGWNDTVFRDDACEWFQTNGIENVSK